MPDFTVTVTVDTATITQANVASTVVLTDDNPDHADGDDTPGDSETFDIETGLNKKILFVPSPNDGSNAVSFDSFVQENNVTAFSDLPSGGTEGNGWIGTTASSSVTGTEKFTINFTVKGKGSFSLDPKLRVQGGG